MTNVEIALAAVKEIYQIWEVDGRRSRWIGEEPEYKLPIEGYGFDWWPGNYQVRLRIHGPHPQLQDPVYRICMQTAYIDDVEVDTQFIHKLSLLNRLTPTFAICSVPPDLNESSFGKAANDKNVFLVSTAYLHDGLKAWLPRFFAGTGVLQLAEAERADIAAKLLGGGRTDQSGPSWSDAPHRLDDLLTVEKSLYAPAGQATSRWIATQEFQEIIERYGRSDISFGSADDTGLTIETSFGQASAMLQLHADQPHPRLGAGLLCVLRLPVGFDSHEASAFSNSLNFFEARSWTERMPLLGSWSAIESDQRGRAGVAYSSFVPNLLYQRGIAENVVLWGIARAQWVRKRWWPDSVDRPMHEILNGRHSKAW